MMKNFKNDLEPSCNRKDDFEQKNLFSMRGGVPDGWTVTSLETGEVRYDGPNGSYFIVKKAS